MDDIVKTLARISIFKNTPPPLLQNIAKQAHASKHKKGKVLFIHGDKAQNYYIIKNGHVKLFRETLDGTQATIDVLTKGDIFAHTLVLEEETYPYSAEIVQPGTIISLPLSDLREAIHTHNDLAVAMLQTVAHQYHQRERELEHRSTQTTSQRIGCFLLRQFQNQQNDSLAINLPYDKMLLAARLGMQPETFSRALSKLKKETGIRTEGTWIYLETLDKLSSYACPACSGRFPCADLAQKRKE
ncbi:MAG: Crp/Fnr family transcriptional regulator [Alphaproteobacteria bacterium]